MNLPSTERRSGDTMVPLINIVFLLLVFFLLAGSLMPPPSVPVRYVESDGITALPSIPPGAIFMDASGGIYLDGARGAPEEIAARLAGAGTGGRALSLVLDRDVTMERVAPLFRALTRTGVGRLEIVTVRGTGR